MHQICPFCKKLVTDEDSTCPYCNKKLKSENKSCPFCKKQISSEDTICPYCNNLLIYEYRKQITSKRQSRVNKIIIPLGIFLLVTAFLYDRYQSFFTGVMHGTFVIGWIVGFAVFFIYLHNGEYYLGWWRN